MTPEKLERLLKVHEEHKQAMAEGDLETYSDLGHAFHREINRAAESHRLAALLNTIVKQLPSRFYVGIDGHVEATGSKHKRLVTAMRKGDPEKARRTMEEHVMEGATYLIDSLEKRGVFQHKESAAAES